MALDVTKLSRRIMMASLLALGAAGAVGCTADEESVASADEDPTGASVDDITGVDQSKVKRQSIGNCWLYATSSWLEALNKGASGVEMNTSESWLTYWHWFEQIANGTMWGEEISTGGSYDVAASLLNRYGVVLEKDFIAAEAESEMSNRQSSALAAINASLKSGALKDENARRDRKLVRAELDKAWGLDPAVVARIDAVFGADVAKTLDKSYVRKAPGKGILRPVDVPALLHDPDTKASMKGTLQDAIGRGKTRWMREGKYMFQEVSYPYDKAQRRAFWKRVQHALHDRVLRGRLDDAQVVGRPGRRIDVAAVGAHHVDGRGHLPLLAGQLAARHGREPDVGVEADLVRGMAGEHGAAARLRDVADEDARPARHLRHLARETLEKGHHVRMAPHAVARQPHDLPGLAVDGQRHGTRHAAA